MKAIKCPDCHIYWKHCPHCNADFCNECGMMADDAADEDDDDEVNDHSPIDYPRPM